MPKLETQGLSEDYQTATGSFDSIDRGDVSKMKLLEILRQVAPLQTPEGADNCPPSINVSLQQDGYFSCFYGDSGVIRCNDSSHEEMTVDEAARVICGEISLAEFDQSKGHAPGKASGPKLVLGLIIVLVVIAIAFSAT